MSRPPAEQRVKAAEMRGREEEAERQRRVWFSCTPLGAFTEPVGLLTMWFIFVGAALGLEAAIMRGLPDSSWVVALPFVVASVATAALAIYARKAVRIAEQRERTWLRALPYHVELYFEVLGDDPSENRRRIELEISFVGERPAETRIAELLGNGWKGTATGAVMTPGIEPGKGNYAHNRPFRTWFHRFTETHLAKLNAAAPFSKLTIFNTTTC